MYLLLIVDSDHKNEVDIDLEKIAKRPCQKREYLLMGLFLAIVLFLAPTILCWHGNFARLGWTPLTFTLLVLTSVIFSSGAYFFLRSEKYFCFLVMFAVFLLAPVWSALMFGIEVKWLNDARYLCQSLIFALIMSGMSVFTSVIFQNIWIKRLIFLLMSFGPVVFAVLFVGYLFTANAQLNAEAIMMILQTNPSEAMEYCRTFLSFGSTLVLLAFFAIWIGFCLWIGKLKRKHMNVVQTFLYGLLMILVLYIGYRVVDQPALPYKVLIQETRRGCEGYAEFKEKREKRMEHVGSLVPAHDANKGVYVLVIGESQNKNHMSAYGYYRKTSPWLDSMKGKTECILFDRVRSCHTHTVRVLSFALTSKNQYNDTKLEDAVTLIEAVKAAGFKTVWLSNQVKYGPFDTPTTVIASEADQQIWLNHHLGDTTEMEVYDGALIDELPKIKHSDRMLIVVHLMGNHTDYSQRYPGDFGKFSGPEKEVDAYDNSILYNDYVMQQLYNEVRKWPDFAGLIYMADHADDPDKGLGHDSSRFTWEMTQIPFYMIFSEEYIKNHTVFFDKLKTGKDKPMTNDLLFNVVLPVLGIYYTELYEPANDISSEQYDANPERFMTLRGKKNIEW